MREKNIDCAIAATGDRVNCPLRHINTILHCHKTPTSHTTQNRNIYTDVSVIKIITIRAHCAASACNISANIFVQSRTLTCLFSTVLPATRRLFCCAYVVWLLPISSTHTHKNDQQTPATASNSSGETVAATKLL